MIISYDKLGENQFLVNKLNFVGRNKYLKCRVLSDFHLNLWYLVLKKTCDLCLISAMSMVLSGVSVFFIPLIHNKYENLGISCVFGAVSTVGWNALDVLSAELFPTSLR